MKNLRIIVAFSFLFLCGCWTNYEACGADCLPENREKTEENNVATTSDEIIDNVLHLNNDCNYHENSKTFIAYAILGTGLNEKGRTEYYLTVNGQGYYVDERGNLSDECWFAGIPTKITIDETQKFPSLQGYVIAKDGSEYESSTKEIFSESAYQLFKAGDYTFNTATSFLEQAEEFYDTKVIPEGNNDFACTFCDKLRYYEPAQAEEDQSNDLLYNYVTKQNDNNTIYFGSDHSFEAKWSRDEGTGTRSFWKDGNTIIVSDSHAEHIYSRYIITHQDEENLHTILEIIQKR